MSPPSQNGFKTRLPTLPSIHANLNPFNRPPLISAPYALGKLPNTSLPSVAHSVDPTSPLGVRSQHASLIAGPGASLSGPGHSTHPYSHPSPIDPPGIQNAPGARAPPRPRVLSDEMETLRNSQYSSEGSAHEGSGTASYKPSEEEVRQFEHLKRPDAKAYGATRLQDTPLLKERRNSRNKGHDEARHHTHDRHTMATINTLVTARSSYPINIDEWAVSPPPDRRHTLTSPTYVERAQSPPVPSQCPHASVTRKASPTGAAHLPPELFKRFPPPPPRDFPASFGTHVHGGNPATEAGLGADLARSNSFPRTAAMPRTSPRRAPPQPLKLVNSNSNLTGPETEQPTRRNSDDSVGIVIEAEHVYPAVDRYPAFSPRRGDDRYALEDVALTPALRPRTPRTPSGTSRKPEPGLVGILKDVRSRSSQWVASAGPKKTVRLASPRSLAWASSVLPSPGPQASQRKSAGKVEFDVVYRDPRGKWKLRWRRIINVSTPYGRANMQWLWVVLAIMICIITIAVPLKMKQKRDSKSTPGALDVPFNTTQGAPISRLDDCLTLFSSEAVGARTGVLYPCSMCVPLLQAAPNDFISGNQTGVGEALQYCALLDVLFASEVTTMQAGGWGVGPPCANWTGVACDERGRVTSLELEHPAIPSTLPPTLSDLVSLISLRVVGDGRHPAGALSPSFTALSNLTTLDLEYTGVSGLVRTSNLSRSLHNVTLVSNFALDIEAPLDLTPIRLKTLVLSGQNLTTTPNLPPTLEFLDLSHNAMAGSATAFLALPNLETLFLQYNNLSRFTSPRGGRLATVSLEGNPHLEGWFWEDVCKLLTACDIRGTAMGPSNKCDVCFEREK